MRIYCKKATVEDFKKDQFLLMLRKNPDSTLVYPFYCGQFDGESTLNKVIYLSRSENLTVHPIDNFSFPKTYLKYNISDIYVITEKEYNLVKACKTKKYLDILLDNLYETR